MPLKRLLILPDTHRPYHDKKAWKLVLKAGRMMKPDIIVVGGDFADFHSVSSHDKNPNRVRCLDEEVRDVNEGLSDLDALGASEKHFISGNHEDRLERFLMQKAPELFNMVRVRDLFKLDERGWKYTAYKQHVQIGKVYFTHDAGRAGKYAHYDAQAAFEDNVVMFHTHRLGYTVVGNAKGKPHVGAMFGWLGDFDAIDYMHRVRAKRDWAMGFGEGFMEPNGVTHLRPVPIVNYGCVIDGKLIRV